MLKAQKLVQVVGLHCHVGSTIRDASVYTTVTGILLNIRENVFSTFRFLRNVKKFSLLITRLVLPLVDNSRTRTYKVLRYRRRFGN